MPASGGNEWPFPEPPLDCEHTGYFSVTKYDSMGLAAYRRALPCIVCTGPKLDRNEDGSITVVFGDDRCAGRSNVKETTEGQKSYYGLGLYRLVDVAETVESINTVRDSPPRPA